MFLCLQFTTHFNRRFKKLKITSRNLTKFITWTLKYHKRRVQKHCLKFSVLQCLLAFCFLAQHPKVHWDPIHLEVPNFSDLFESLFIIWSKWGPFGLESLAKSTFKSGPKQMRSAGRSISCSCSLWTKWFYSFSWVINMPVSRPCFELEKNLPTWWGHVYSTISTHPKESHQLMKYEYVWNVFLSFFQLVQCVRARL